MKITFWKIFLISFILMTSCERTSFMETSSLPDNVTVTNLSYPSIVNARAYSAITTAVPTMDSDGIPCVFDVVSVRSEAEGVLPEEYLDYVTIASAFMDTIVVEEIEEGDTTYHNIPVANPNKAGQITIAEDNMFGEGDYYFTLSVTPVTDGDENAQVFEDAFYLNVMPLLPTGIAFDPVQQNLVVGQADSKTVAPTLTFSKEVPTYDVRFELLNGADTLVIDEATGEISLAAGFNITRNMAIAPSIRVISNRTEEVVDFAADASKLQIVISDEPLVLNAGELLPPSLIYIPFAQNLVEGVGGAKTNSPDVSKSNPSLAYELVTETDKLVIDDRTGEISIKEGYVLTEDVLELMPTIKITSLISYDEREYVGDIKVVLSRTPQSLLPSTFHFFYPTMVNVGNNAGNNYKKVTVVKDGVGNGLFWKSKTNFLPDATTTADAERPASVPKGGQHGVNIHNYAYGPGRSGLHDSWMVMDAQNLSEYNSDGYDVKAVFWMKNDRTILLEDGSVAANLEVYITDDYTGANSSEWTQVNDMLTYKILGSGDEMNGTPKPGPGTDTYQKWVRYELDLNDYKGQKNFTLAFRYKTTIEETLEVGTDINGTLVDFHNCTGQFLISDVNYKAIEK